MATEEDRGQYEVQYSPQDYHKMFNSLLDFSSQHLRTIFTKRWVDITKSEWKNGDQKQREEFSKFTLNGKKLVKAIQAFQKQDFQKWQVEEWDMTLLHSLLLFLENGESHKTENQSVRLLKKIRNELEHSDKKLYKSEYDSKLDVLRTACIKLAMDETELQNKIDAVGKSLSQEAWKTAEMKLNEANLFRKNHDLENAVSVCTEALQIPSLLPKDQGTIYETRAEIHLSRETKDISNEIQQQMLLDLTTALQINDRSWKAHYLSAKLYRIQDNFQKAISHFQTSLALSPDREWIKLELDGSKYLSGQQTKEEHLDPRLMGKNLSDHLEELERQHGLKMTPAEFMKIQHQVGSKFFPGNHETFQGHCFRYGWDCEQDYKEAAKCYERAAEKGNLEGSYNLALLYCDGRGVIQNTDKAASIFRKVAEMSPDTVGVTTTSFFKNIGVAGSQYLLGLFCEGGISMGQNYSEAANWYKKAMLNGVGNAANNLGLLHLKGLAMAPDHYMAEMCWKLAVELGDVNAPVNLTQYYMREMEPQKCRAILRIAEEMGRLALKNYWCNEAFDWVLNEQRKNRQLLEPGVLAIERKMSLPIKGWTFQARLKRKDCIDNAQNKKLWAMKEHFKMNEIAGGIHLPHDVGWKTNKQVLKNVQFQRNIFHKCSTGEATENEKSVARSILFAWYMCLTDYQILFQNAHLPDEDKIKLVKSFYLVCTTDSLDLVVLFVYPHHMEMLKSWVKQLYQDNHGYPGNDDMMIRYCYVKLILTSETALNNDFVIEIIREGLNRYPDNMHFYDELTLILATNMDFQGALEYIEKGLEHFPDSSVLLHSKAACLRNLLTEPFQEAEIQKVLGVLDHYLETSEDNLGRPSAYYEISFLYYHLLNKGLYSNGYISDEFLQKVKQNYDLALAAEKSFSACYEPCGSPTMKVNVEWLLGQFGLIEGQSGEQDSYTDTLLERRPYLRSPNREGLMKQFRKRIQESRKRTKDNEQDNFTKACSTTKPNLKHTFPNDLGNIEPITLLELNPTVERIYQNKILELLIIEEPVLGFPALGLLAEDENGDVVRLYVYNVKHDKEWIANLSVGSKIGILNPYLRKTAMEISHAIRVDEPKCLRYRGTLESMCRFCGEDKANKPCKKCKRLYCSEECLNLDREMFDHEIICELGYN